MYNSNTHCKLNIFIKNMCILAVGELEPTKTTLTTIPLTINNELYELLI